MITLDKLIQKYPIVPFIRQSEFAPRKPWRIPKRRLLDYLFIYVQEGKCRFQVDEEDYLFQSGQFCLIQPGSLVELEGITNTVTPFAHFDIFYHPKREKSFPTRPGQINLANYRDLMQPELNEIYGLHVPVRLQPSHPDMLMENLYQIVELWQQHNPMMQVKAQYLAMEMVISILEDCFQVKENSLSLSNPFNWITSYFSLHLNDPLSIEDMAQVANLSVSRFSALFKQRYGLSPHQYLLNMRINHARELLEGTALSQQEISLYCGFADVHHFSKTFKKKTGQTPGEWRIRGQT